MTRYKMIALLLSSVNANILIIEKNRGNNFLHLIVLPPRDKHAPVTRWGNKYGGIPYPEGLRTDKRICSICYDANLIFSLLMVNPRSGSEDKVVYHASN